MREVNNFDDDGTHAVYVPGFAVLSVRDNIGNQERQTKKKQQKEKDNKTLRH
jgi:hypothetical protein